MADKTVVAEVMRVLKQAGIEFDAEGERSLRGRLEDAPVMPDLATGDVAVELDREALIELAVRNSHALAEVLLDEQGTGPHSKESLDAALRGLCPIWPFC